MLLNHEWTCDDIAPSPQPSLHLSTSNLEAPKSLQRRLVLPSCRFPHHIMVLCPTRRLLGTWGSTMWSIWLMNTCVTTFIILPGWRPGSHRFPGHCICLGTDAPLSRTLLCPIPVRGACVEEVIGNTHSHCPVPS